eukprot:Opistho-2@77476
MLAASLRRSVSGGHTGAHTFVISIPRAAYATVSKSDRDYDLCVVGGGPAGFASAVRAYDLGRSVCLIERGHLGGAGVHNGALSSKTMWQLSRKSRVVYDTLKDAGIVPRGNYGSVLRQVAEATTAKEHHMIKQLNDMASSNSHRTVSVLKGSAAFVDPHTVEVTDLKGEKKRVTADNFVIATGSRPRAHNKFKVDGRHVITSDHILDMRDFPKSMLIIGAGVIGCEFATIFANFGQTKVHLLNEGKARLLPTEDEDVTNLISSEMRRMGVHIHNECKLLDLKIHGGKVDCTLGRKRPGSKAGAPDEYEATECFSVEKVLLSIGRIPNLDNIGIENAGVQLDKAGGVAADKHAKSSVPHIYAAGDATADVGLVNVAEMEARHAVERLFGCDETVETELCYDNLSTIMFLNPEVACVGLNEGEARRRRIPYRVGVYGFDLVHRAIINHSATGFVKLIVSADEEMRLLGMRAVGDDSSAVIQTASMLITEGKSISHLARLLHPHPAITEAVQECVRMFYGTSIYKPEFFPSCKVREWYPDNLRRPEEKPNAVVPSYLS